MLLQSIELKNFRQFRDEKITFAQGIEGKNVTIILGENGTGKTTFAQAFFWCMYNDTEFTDKVLLNRLTANRMNPGEKETVSVELRLQHGENSYSLKREQTYRKEPSGSLKADFTNFTILRRDNHGNTMPIKASMLETEINSILPKELSKYFFFDGERIERMSKDISTHKKATDFAEAVKSLLGLKGMESALVHLNPRSKSSVIGSYEASYDGKSNAQIQQMTTKIAQCKQGIDAAQARIEELDRQIELAETRREQLRADVKQYEDGERLQQQKEKLEKELAAIRQSQRSTVRTICTDFSTYFGSYFSVWMIQRALQMLQEKDFTGKDIPHMHADTIEYLLRQGVCICGTSLNEGSVAYGKVKNLIDYLPPKSLSSNIGDFKKAVRRRVNLAQQTDLLDRVAEHLSSIGRQEEEMTDKTADLMALESKMTGDDVRATVRHINSEIKTCDDTIRLSREERDRKVGLIGKLEGDMQRAESRRSQLALVDDKNRKTELYKTYAQKVYDELLAFYSQSEKEVRDKLQDTINEIFRQIYEGGLSLTIDDKYRISVYADEYLGDVETSTAQSISVILAFISGIIKMARENRNATDQDAQLLSSEPYPLVMDAPLSAFDKRRIKTICTALPEIAEQVVIFIKDTDGDLAEEHMGERIGSRHRFEKLNEFETHLL